MHYVLTCQSVPFCISRPDYDLIILIIIIIKVYFYLQLEYTKLLLKLERIFKN